MTKQEFLELDEIRVTFNLDNYNNSQSIIKEYHEQISNLQDFFHPWYRFDGEVVKAEDAGTLNVDITELGVTLKDIDLVDVDGEKKDGIRNISFGKLHSVPVATDIKSGISLILDSNHTLSNLFRKYLEGGEDILIPVAELVGENLDDIFYDFKILNKDLMKV